LNLKVKPAPVDAPPWARSLRSDIVQVLQELGPKGKAAIPLLLPMLTDKADDEKIYACNALQAIGPEGKEAVPALIPFLNDSSEGVQGAAAAALGKMGPAAKAAIPTLLKMPYWGRLGNNNEIGDAVVALKELATPLLLEKLKDPQEQRGALEFLIANHLAT